MKNLSHKKFCILLLIFLYILKIALQILRCVATIDQNVWNRARVPPANLTYNEKPYYCSNSDSDYQV